ncbi:FMN-binding protein [Sinimarinibacterium flocculans]|uniref:FMN-binding protein n=1 Tax=Sinimarinibacterium flocculans TaxID=985250 RepID=UPI00248FD554|nr:FMN-binding protein [Sinimarinibacterium flocculans]
MKKSTQRALLLCLGLSALAPQAHAEECPPIICKTFITREAFLAEAFGNTLPPVQSLVFDEAKQAKLTPIYGRRFPQARLRYWRGEDGRTAWIFDDIGKEGYQPTTSGFVVKDGAIEMARVLFYKESRGEQVGELSFLHQLLGARASGEGLDRSVDNISGATYSVKLMQRMARTALMFDELAASP